MGEDFLKVLNYVYGLFIIFSVVMIIVEIVDCEKGIKCLDLYLNLFFVLDVMFVVVFMLEFFICFGLFKNCCVFMK